MFWLVSLVQVDIICTEMLDLIFKQCVIFLWIIITAPDLPWSVPGLLCLNVQCIMGNVMWSRCSSRKLEAVTVAGPWIIWTNSSSSSLIVSTIYWKFTEKLTCSMNVLFWTCTFRTLLALLLFQKSIFEQMVDEFWCIWKRKNLDLTLPSVSLHQTTIWVFITVKKKQIWTPSVCSPSSVQSFQAFNVHIQNWAWHSPQNFNKQKNKESCNRWCGSHRALISRMQGLHEQTEGNDT